MDSGYRARVIHQSRALLRTAFWLSITLVPVLGLAVFARLAFAIPWNHLLGDPATAMGAPFYIGFVSNVGVVLWAATASIFLFSYRLLGRRGGEAEWRRFLLCSGLFVGWLGLDDLFLLHDHFFPDVLSISQPVIVGAYAMLALLYLWRFAPLIYRTDFLILLAAFCLLATSLALDQFPIPLLGRDLWEDAAKLLGIGAWLSYAVHTSIAVLAGTTAPCTLPRSWPRFIVEWVARRWTRPTTTARPSRAATGSSPSGGGAAMSQGPRARS